MAALNALLSRITTSTVGLTCKTFLNIGYCSSVSVDGLEHLKDALGSAERDAGRGVITSTRLPLPRTISAENLVQLAITSLRTYTSISVCIILMAYLCCMHARLDDPVTWGVLPARYFFSSRTMRWTLGASDILFTNPYVFVLSMHSGPDHVATAR